jgi:predicted 3-demethylubiquinone-9 3-methyltransferase (glyoxalase superfamily)
MVAEFELDGTRFVGINGGPQFTFSEAVSLQVRCMTQEEVDHYWDALTDGGEEGPCGWLKDRYGVSWQVTPEGMDELFAHSDPDAAKRDGGDVRDEEARPVALRAAAEGAPARR